MAKVDAVDGDSASFPASPNPGPVEARSLSTITSIASNPPSYPRNPTQKKLDPLVLYIVRVPGSKDVFLSPLKPPTKSSVSAEAINASLYYLHVATPDDDAILQEYEQEREEQARLRREGLVHGPDMPLQSSEFARLNNVRRKPVPGAMRKPDIEGAQTSPHPDSSQPQVENTPVPQFEDSIPPPMLPPRPTSSPIEAMARLTAGATDTFLDQPRREQEMPPPMPPRTLPSVPQDETSFDSYTASKKNNRWSAFSGYAPGHLQMNRNERYEAVSTGRHSIDTARPQIRPRSSHESSSYAHTRSPGQSPNRRPHDITRPHQPGFHITLIRRDPAHGSQWNVATISTPQLDGSGIDIEVSTPGYSRFATHNESLSLEGLGLNLPAEARHNLVSSHPAFTTSKSDLSAIPANPSTPSNQSHPRRFHRKVFVSKPLNSDDPRSSLDLTGNRASMDSIGGSSPIKPYNSGSSKLKSGYYTFTSPWNGICTFSTSVNGRSLKCKHMIPTPGFPNSSSNHDNPAVTVAEIRFNTPFQAGHHHSGSTHISPFALSQTPVFKDFPSTTDPSITTSHHHHFRPSTPPSSSKRAALANFINQTARHTYGLTRRLSNSSTSSAGGGPGGDLAPYASPERRQLLRHPASDDRLDLSLAREPAGGGLRGKSAKLGKLIIEDEGIKMLDLVVAACMGVWWRGYYY